MPGRQRTPTSVLLRRGSKRAKYERTGEPKPTMGDPKETANLEGEELQVYEVMVEKLTNMGVLSLVDGASIERYAHMTVRYWTIARFLRKEGETVEVMNSKGIVQRANRPEVAVLDKLAVQLLAIEKEFGLTPCSRPKIDLEKTQLEDKDKAKFFN